ncbi:MAG: S-layer homology domain-containing protein, partial [Bifidobacteriaceae bacterium]|nr:S-layer homology domain-containing protein [Bifidobacteriaceae bacterium]
MKNILNRNLEVELKNSKFKIINKSFVLNNLIAVIIIALCFTILPIANTPLAQAESSQTAQTQKTSTSANNNHASNDHISNDHASNKTAPNNLIDPPPAVNNVTISRSQNHNSVVVTWSAPDTPPASYTYRVDLINNISSVAQSINNINSNITNASFNNLSTGNYNAVVYTVVDNILSNPVQSSVPISVALSPIATSTNFNDIAKLPANFQAAIKWAAIYTITAGYSDGGFHPATPTTRGQMATFFHKLAGNPNTQGTPTAFKDIAKSVHKADINWLSTQGITAGYSCTAKGKPVITCAKKGDLVYYPEGKITRVQMATFLYKFASSPTMTPDEVNSYLSTFKDKEQIIASGQDTPIAWLVKNNITKGFTCTAFGSPDPACTKAGDIVFRPKYNTTRQQMVLFLQKAAATLNLSAYLKAEGSNPSTFLGVSNPTRDQITKISFQDTLPKCSNPTDVSADGSGGVLVCVNNLTELVVGSVGQVPANSNSSNLFANLLVANSTNLAGVQIDFTNFNTTGLINTAAMFANTKLAQVSNWSPDFANTSKNMSNMFASASLPVNLALPSDFGIAVQDMSNMFDKAVLQSNIEWKQTDFTDRTGVKKQNMFDGTVWNNHVIYALNEPSVNFFLDNTKALPDNIMIKGGTSYLKVEGSNPSTFLGLSNPTRDAITKVSFQNQLPVCSNPTDVSVDGGGGVLACVENNTEIVIGANGGVLANDNSSYLLANLSKSTGVDIDLSNLKNDIIDNMSSLFQNSKLKILINCPTNFGSTTSNMQSMFAGATLPDNLILPPRFANRAINMTNMWQNAVLGGDIDWSFTDFNNHAAATKTNMFTGVSWNTHSVLVQDNIDQAFLIDQTGATVNNIQIKNYSSVLKAESANPATFLGLASPTRDAITKISFQNTLPSCTNPVDVSVDGKNGVLACVENNTEIVIGSKGGVLANEDSSNLLSNLTKSTGVTIDLSSFYGFSATNMSNFFKSTILKSTPIWSDGFGGSVANMSNLFQQSTLSADFSLPAGFGSQATNMSNIFASVSLPSNFILPAQFGSQATNMSSAFANSTLNT